MPPVLVHCILITEYHICGNLFFKKKKKIYFFMVLEPGKFKVKCPVSGKNLLLHHSMAEGKKKPVSKRESNSLLR